jgi:SAM-dependent methyltransferase
MHSEALGFLRSCAKKFRQPGAAVLDIGSRDVNGSPRPLFDWAAAYVGLDVRSGKGVDVVMDARAFHGMGFFDIAISAETLEHEAEPEIILQCAWRALKPGGTLILTAASIGRLPHNCDGVEGSFPGEHYANIHPYRLRNLLADWKDVIITFNGAHGDVYATARKPEGEHET